VTKEEISEALRSSDHTREQAIKYPEIVDFFSFAMRDKIYSVGNTQNAWYWFLKGFLLGVNV
jgi:hypothetical protein